MVPSSPLVSVVIPTHDRRPMLERAVASVLSQTVTELELLIVDDGSTDDTAEWLASLTDRRVRSWSLPSSGVAAARNRALREATGTWIGFLDDDNEWRPGYLAAQLATARVSIPAPEVVHSLALLRDAGGADVLGPTPPPGGPTFEALLFAWFPFLSACLVRRSALEQAGGFQEHLEVAEDWDLLLRLAARSPFATTPEPLLVRHDHAGPHLGRDHVAYSSTFERLDRDWRAEIVRRAGRRSYGRFVRDKLGGAWVATYMEDFDAAGRGGALRALVRMARHLPWTARPMLKSAAAAVVGPRAYPRCKAAFRRLRPLSH